MKKYLILLIAACLLSGNIIAQNCHIEKTDVSGFNTADFQGVLETAACDLRNSFPSEFANQFKVVEYGLYMLTPSTIDGIPPMFERTKLDASAESPYYLLVTKQSDTHGLYTKFLVDVKLPETGIFTCLTPTSRNLINERIRFAIEGKYTQLGRAPFQYAEAIISGMNELKSVITNINNGICCETDPEKIYNVLVNTGFASFPCKILPNTAARPSGNTAGRSTGEVLDFAYLDIEEAGVPNDINGSLSQIISGLASAGLSAKGYITKNENFCDSSKFEIARTQYSVSLNDFDVWFHLWKNPDNSGDDILFVKSEKLDEIANNFQAPATAPWYPLTKSLLVTHVTTKCPPTIEINNFIGEEVFEDTWHVFAETNFSPIFFYRRNPPQSTYSGGCRPTSPDGLATSYTPVSQIAFPDASWYEVKATNCDVYLSSYENQIRAHIQNLQIAQPNACINRAAWFNLVSTVGVEVSSSVYRYAGGFRIKVLHWEAWYQYNTNGKMEVKFGIKTSLNRLAPSLFPPDFQSYLGYQPVLLQNCD
jgi:hypothetical protein